MGLQLFVNNVRFERDWSGRFYGIRIGTGGSNDVVVSENTPGVQEHHCTIVHTGSTYRLEMLPSHLVFVDGERAECGQQLFRSNTQSCVLSIGGAPPSRSATKFLAPPQIKLVRVGERTEAVPVRPDHRGPKTNFDLSKYVRVSIRNLVLAVTGLAAASVLVWGYFYLQDQQIKNRLDQVAKLTDLPPSSAVAEKGLSAVFQIGVAKGEAFFPSGTAWAWEKSPGDRRLVTNIHVFNAVNNCAQSATEESREKCKGGNSGCPALRYFADEGGKYVEKILPIGMTQQGEPCGKDTIGALKGRIHADYTQFQRWTGHNATLTLPNIYDVALVDWPQSMADWQDTLSLEDSFSIDPRGLKPGRGIAIFGYPSEGGRPTDVAAGRAMFRPGWIGRTSDPFGLPSKIEEDFITVSGPEVIGGESGGPIIDRDGKVVAVTFANFSQDLGTEGRISYGSRMLALSARVLLDENRFVTPDEAEKGVPPPRQRLEAWSAGLSRMSADRRKVLIGDLQARCASGGALVGQPSVRKVQASTAYEFPLGPEKMRGWAYSTDFELDGAIGSSSSVLVLVRSLDNPPAQVILSSQIGQTSRAAASSDPTSTLASAWMDVTFSEKKPRWKGSYVVFSPDDVGKDARLEVEFYRADCGKGGAS